MPTVCSSSFVHLGCVLSRNSADIAFIAVTDGNRICISVETHRKSIRANTVASTQNYEYSVENWCNSCVLQQCNVHRVNRCEVFNVLSVLFQYCLFSTGESSTRGDKLSVFAIGLWMKLPLYYPPGLLFKTVVNSIVTLCRSKWGSCWRRLHWEGTYCLIIG